MRCGISVKWLVLWSVWAARLVPQRTPPVPTGSGLVSGFVSPDGCYVQYMGIPYATVPRRFQESQPAQWSGIYDAFDEHVRCTQRFTSSRVLGQEDCLRANVYSPLPAPGRLLPVMIFIHGGGFRDGSGSPLVYGPEYFLKHGVILVTFNYRLEVLGFLSLGLKDAPGNVGLKDQVQALRWVRDNIRVFGGDPDNVTIFGESAGSASVMYHLVSPMSKGLFHRAIMQSGSAMSPWSMQYDPVDTAKLLAKYTNKGGSYDTPEKVLDLFKSMTAEELMSTRVPRKEGDIVLSENIFVPCVEKLIPGVEVFLPDTPYNLLTKGIYNKVPVIIGFNDAEGFMFAGKENDTVISKLDFFAALPRDLDMPDDEKRRVADVFERYYMGGKKISKDTMAEFARYEGDSSIIYPVVFSTDLLARTSDKEVYAYKFSYDGWMNYAKMVFGFSKNPGATHADELFYMFKIKVTLLPSLLETKMVGRMTTMWTNFAKYGNPTPHVTPLTPIKWPQADSNDPKLLHIDKELAVEPLWQDEIIKFWNTTYTKYRRKK